MKDTNSKESELQFENGKVVDQAKGDFDISRLRLSQDFHQEVGVKKILISVPVRKPSKQEFFRVHPGKDMYLQTLILEDSHEGESYLVDPSLWGGLVGELVPKALYLTINTYGTVSIWPLRLPGENGRGDRWCMTALEAAEIAKSQWIRLRANMILKAYEVYIATGYIDEPQWPDLGFPEIIKIAFKERYVDTIDHPVLKRLRGES